LIRKFQTVEKPTVTGSKTKQLVESWRMNQALVDGKFPADLGLPLKGGGNLTPLDLRSRLDAMRQSKTQAEPERNRRADSVLRELVDGLERVGKEGVPEKRQGPSYESKAPKPVPSARDALAWLADAMEAKGHPEAGVVREAAEAVKAPVEAKAEVAKESVRDSEIKNTPVAAEKVAPVKVAKGKGQDSALIQQPTAVTEKPSPVEPTPTKSPRKSPGKSPGKSALAKEMEAMGLDFAKPEDYATYRIMKLIEGGKPLPQEKVARKKASRDKTDTVDKEAEARLAEDLAREESKARKRVEEEKARDEQPEVEPDGEEGKGSQGLPFAETPSDSKEKSADEDGKVGSPKSEVQEKPTRKAKKSTPTTPEQAAKEALWKFQAAISPSEGEITNKHFSVLAVPTTLPTCRRPSIR
jgi:hypothetical protein